MDELRKQIEELKKKAEEHANTVDDLKRKVEDLSNPATIPQEFLRTLSEKGFLKVDSILETPFTTLDGYDSKYYYVFTNVNRKNVVISTINSEDFTIIKGINTSTDILTAPSHGFDSGDAFTFWTSGTAPSPLVNGGTYYARDITTDTFKLAAALGGAAINITTNGSGAQYLQRINILL